METRYKTWLAFWRTDFSISGYGLYLVLVVGVVLYSDSFKSLSVASVVRERRLGVHWSAETMYDAWIVMIGKFPRTKDRRQDGGYEQSGVF